jgi:hypothetical protein
MQTAVFWPLETAVCIQNAVGLAGGWQDRVKGQQAEKAAAARDGQRAQAQAESFERAEQHHQGT